MYSSSECHPSTLLATCRRGIECLPGYPGGHRGEERSEQALTGGPNVGIFGVNQNVVEERRSLSHDRLGLVEQRRDRQLGNTDAKGADPLKAAVTAKEVVSSSIRHGLRGNMPFLYVYQGEYQPA